jgi:arylsulfatase A-like enzyme
LTDRPNIVFLLPDQLRADFLGCYGAGFIQTPQIDSLAERGVRYERAVSPSPLCVPARASLLTGRNAIENGVLTNDQWLRPDREACGITTWPQLLAEAGYCTAAIGKMHFYPWDAREGFQRRVVAEDKRHIRIQDDYAHYLQRHGLRKYHGNEHDGYFEHKGAIVSKIPAEHQVDTWVANQACAFIEDYRDERPFALMVAFPGPHDPYDPPPELAGLFDPAAMPDSIPATAESDASREGFIASYLRPWNGVDYREFTEPQKKKIRAHYAALVHQIDRGVGRILATLDDRGLAGETTVIFASDHGDLLGDFGRVGKSVYYESSTRVPLIVKHPRCPDARVVRSTVSLTDLHATILRFAGAPGVAGGDSVPLPGFGDEAGAGRAYVFGATGSGLMVTDDRWKLARYRNGDAMLFDRENDPLEQRNLAYLAEHAEAMRRLDRIMQEELLASIVAGHGDKIVVTHDREPAFSRPGFPRAYPHPL